MLNKYKVYVKDPKTSEEVQRHAITLGFRWRSSRNIQFLESNFLFFENGIIDYETKDFKYFREQSFLELSPCEFLKLTKEDIPEIPKGLSSSDILKMTWKEKASGICFKILVIDSSNTPYLVPTKTGDFQWVSKETLLKDYIGFEEPLSEVVKDKNKC